MRFLGDENFPLGSLKVLRDAGHETASVTRISPGVKDPRVILMAVGETRIVLTFDKDFYRRVYEDRLVPPGLVLFRMRKPGRREAGERLLALLESGLSLAGFFTIVERDRYDQFPLPE